MPYAATTSEFSPSLFNGNMIAVSRSSLVNYRESCIMTFECSHHVQILQEDLGPDSAKIAAAITGYDPDSTWQSAD